MRLALLASAVALCCAPAAEGKLRFERQDGTRVPMPGAVRVWCGPWAADVAEPALVVATRPGRPFSWVVAAVRRDLLRGHAFAFPHSFLWDHPSDALIFAVDRRNEASTAEEGAGGRLFFDRISCRPGRVVSFRVTATLGSELSGPPISVSGTFRGRVGTRTWPTP